MKVVILAGGRGTRISEETTLRPKPMIEIGGRPILWHIMKIYCAHGVDHFIICCGYKGTMIKEYFANYALNMADVTFDMSDHSVHVHHNNCEPWRVTLVDTGEDTGTGGRLRRVRSYLEDDDCFCFTYGDGVSDVNIRDLIAFHRAHGKLATVTAIQPPVRYGVLVFDRDRFDRSDRFDRPEQQEVVAFEEKPEGEGGWINGGFAVLSPAAIDTIDGDEVMWEHAPMKRLVQAGQLAAYMHRGFWHPMDTLRDKLQLEALWASGEAPWKVW